MPSSVNEMDRLHTRGINGREGSGGRALTDGEAGVGASERQDVGAGQTQPHSQQQQNATSGERFFSVRWMLERERARSESDDCSSAFAIIPVVGVGLLALYVMWLDQATQRFMLWLARGTPLAFLSPSKLSFLEGLFEHWDWMGPGDGVGDNFSFKEAFA